MSWLVEHVTISEHENLWLREAVTEIRRQLWDSFRRLPTLSELADRYGGALVGQVMNRVLAQRRSEVAELSERMGLGAPCHLCGRPRRESDPSYRFGLAVVVSSQRNWAGAIAMLLLNVVTIPLGRVVASIPGKSTTARISRCRLVMCVVCAQRRTGPMGGMTITEADCRVHPSWPRLTAAGFDAFLSAERLAAYR